MDTTLFIIGILYAINGLISLVAYVPTIYDLIIHKKPSANIQSYIVWTYTGGIGLLYASLIIHDLRFIVVSGIGFICNLIVLLLSILLKYRNS